MQLDLPALLRALVRSDSRVTLARVLTDAFASSRSVVLVRVWLWDGDGSLVLASSAGTPSGGGTYTRLDGEFREMALSDAKIHEIAASPEPFVVRGLRGDEEWLINSAWAARQGVRSFLGVPMIARERPVALLAVFDREMPEPNLVADIGLAADIAAHRLAELTSVPAREGRRSLGGTEVLTRGELRRIEKANIEAALAHTQGKVFGADGAAALLGMRPTTLASRLKALGISRS